MVKRVAQHFGLASFFFRIFPLGFRSLWRLSRYAFPSNKISCINYIDWSCGVTFRSENRQWWLRAGARAQWVPCDMFTYILYLDRQQQPQRKIVSLNLTLVTLVESTCFLAHKFSLACFTSTSRSINRLFIHLLRIDDDGTATDVKHRPLGEKVDESERQNFPIDTIV